MSIIIYLRATVLLPAELLTRTKSGRAKCLPGTHDTLASDPLQEASDAGAQPWVGSESRPRRETQRGCLREFTRVFRKFIKVIERTGKAGRVVASTFPSYERHWPSTRLSNAAGARKRTYG